jgi:ankyrin repeat protein
MNLTDSEGYLPLHAACIWDNVMATRILVEKGGEALLSEAFRDDLASESPLHCVCVSGNEEIAKVLLSAGGQALTEVTDKDGNTPLQTACKYGRFSVVKLLLKVRQERIVRVTKANGQNVLDVAKGDERLDSRDEITLIKEYINERRLLRKIE